MRVGNDVVLMGSDVLFPYNHDRVGRAGNGMEAAARALPTSDVSFSILAYALQVDAGSSRRRRCPKLSAPNTAPRERAYR
jgi:hypothetical protein